ncbi:ABC transporter permease [Halobacillus salinus]|uniref:FtsX-like permease family protein n=1 Tax=Halobacillus salinus TaxID=192814 RepID=A0A4Z0GZU1_9BACI|nr:ABC transporter permease [Halobacillus salinus]TGB03742.1 FtsX-like permease family protein [Halobacillus salinus]
MFHYLWKSWKQHKERLILMLIGMLVISGGLSYLFGLSKAQDLTVTEELQKRWKSSYDIVVRPPGSQSMTEEDELLEPNFLNGIHGGITLDQYEQIKSVADVETAAPVAVIGYSNMNIMLDEFELEEPGIYKISSKESTEQGDQSIGINSYEHYFSVGWTGGMSNLESNEKYGFYNTPSTYVRQSIEPLIVGIDPEQEARLVGLDEAIVEGDYLDALSEYEGSRQDVDAVLPVLLRNDTSEQNTFTHKLEKLDLPFESDAEIEETLKQLEENGKQELLAETKGNTVERWDAESRDLYQALKESIVNDRYFEQDQTDPESLPMAVGGGFINYFPASLSYEKVESPYPERWPFAYGIEPTEATTFDGESTNALRDIEYLGSERIKRLAYQSVGTYDPALLQVSKDPLNNLPLETYRLPTADLVLGEDGEPLNPVPEVKTTGEPDSFLTPAPTVLTTLEAAAQLSDGAPISAIRVKVEGIETLSTESQEVLDQVASDIESETGLITDITLGSSPQPTVVHVPGAGEMEELGWVEQPWIKLGTAINIFNETKLGFSGVVIGLVAVGIIYVLSTNLILSLRRRKEFAILLSLGWRVKDLLKMVVVEAALMSLAVIGISFLTLFLFFVRDGVAFDAASFIQIAVFAIVIYLIGALWPAYFIRKIKPYEAIRIGEIATKSSRIVQVKGLITMAFGHFFSKIKRNLLSVLAIAIPTVLLSFFIFVTFRMQGVLYTTMLGQYISVEISSIHYISMGVAAVLSILTTMELIWQNVTDRKEEITLLRSLGWKNRYTRLMVYWEGAFVGLLAAIIGLGGAFALIWGLYQQFPVDYIGTITLTGLIPVLMGIIGSLIPGEIAVRMKLNGMK